MRVIAPLFPKDHWRRRRPPRLPRLVVRAPRPTLFRREEGLRETVACCGRAFAATDDHLIIELDGPAHDLEDRQLHDAVRTAWLESQGYRVMRFPNRTVFEQPDGMIAQITAALSRSS